MKQTSLLNLTTLKCKFTLILLLTVLIFGQNNIIQNESAMHPTFALLDENSQNVINSKGAISTMKTCGKCHDTKYIESHSYHSSFGFDKLTTAGETNSGREWDVGNGAFGKWNPFLYRYLSPIDDDQIDMGTADWIRTFSAMHIGSGPACRSTSGSPLTELEKSDNDFQTHANNPLTGETEIWDWQDSGVVEMNCFICHIPNPDNQARINELQSGRFRWANTAILAGTGIVEKIEEQWQWNSNAFTYYDHLKLEYCQMQPPSDANCGLCHGLVRAETEEPLATGYKPNQCSTETTGQIISSDRLFESNINLSGKVDLTRSCDIHAERLLNCIDCHYSVNNPIYYQEPAESRPDHLKFNPRRMDINDYLYRPNHQFSLSKKTLKCVTSNTQVACRSCKSCHNSEEVHDWLPYKERHFDVLSCESCHIPKMYAPALRQYDWTVLDSDGKPNKEYRGIEGKAGEVNALITGYEPILLPRQNSDNNLRLTPYNLITFWFWVHGDPVRPVRIQDLKKAYFDGVSYHATVISALDNNKDGKISKDELVLDTDRKIQVISARLKSLGLENPTIRGEIQPFSIHHTVAGFDWATKECMTCHNQESKLYQPILLSAAHPSGIKPQFTADADFVVNGQIFTANDGEFFYQPDPRKSGFYIMGHDQINWLNNSGLILFLLIVTAVFVHAGLRIISAKKSNNRTVATKEIYMYHAYERFWHWLQALAIILLIFTGLIIHSPDTYRIFDFAVTVQIHNIMGLILLINAIFAVFYHVVAGEIKQYLPAPSGFFEQAITQTIYYLSGIFSNKPHPFEKTPSKKLNPLQKITYLMILNVLLPLQIITGIAIWGAQLFPEITNKLGRLQILVPLHSFIAWLFAGFVIMHMYLTTTGHTPLSGIKAMLIGWEEVEKK